MSGGERVSTDSGDVDHRPDTFQLYFWNPASGDEPEMLSRYLSARLDRRSMRRSPPVPFTFNGGRGETGHRGDVLSDNREGSGAVAELLIQTTLSGTSWQGEDAAEDTR